MRKVKLVVHECYAGKRKAEEVFAAVFLSNAAAFTEGESFRGDHATPPLGPAKERSFPPEATLLLEDGTMFPVGRRSITGPTPCPTTASGT